MNNEPVAWISRLPEGDVYNCAWAEKQNDDDIPLYTHPVKELTDKLRIKELESEIERLQDQLNEFLVTRDLAILRKAQEK